MFGLKIKLGWKLKNCVTFGKRRLFACDSFRSYLVRSVKDLANKGKMDTVVIPGGATWHIQATDVSWNKPIKEQLREVYEQWMDEGPHTHTKGGKMRGPQLKQIVQWTLKAWSDLNKEIIIKSFVAVLYQYKMMRTRTTKFRVWNLGNHWALA